MLTLKKLKIVIATGLSLGLAHILKLENGSSAGIIAMLSVLDTRKASVRVAWQRLFSTVIALFLGVVSFSVLGFHLLGFLLYLTLFVVIAQRYQLQAVIAPCSVLVTHLWLSQNLTLSFLWNECLLMVIGVGVAIGLHLYMPSRQNQILSDKEKIETDLRRILRAVAKGISSWDRPSQDMEMAELEDFIQRAKQVVYQEQDNRLFRQIDYDVHYLDMRMSQVILLKIMQSNLQACQLDLTEVKLLSGLFEMTASQLSEKNPGTQLLAAIEEMLEHFRRRELPKTRQEFETRAVLFQVLMDLKRFIHLKIDFYHHYSGKGDSLG